MENKSALIIFAKYPEPGKVKTRLAKTLGNNFAVQFYKACLERIFKIAAGINEITPFLFYNGDFKNDFIPEDYKHVFVLKEQTGNDLGERMQNAFKFVFSESYNRAVIIGTDVPGLTSEHIDNSLNNLDRYDVSLIPSDDGGYNLAALKELHEELFTGIEWSTDSVFRVTLEKAEQLSLNVKVNNPLLDIDTEEDLKTWLNSHSGEIEFKNKIRRIMEL